MTATCRGHWSATRPAASRPWPPPVRRWPSRAAYDTSRRPRPPSDRAARDPLCDFPSQDDLHSKTMITWVPDNVTSLSADPAARDPLCDFPSQDDLHSTKTITGNHDDDVVIFSCKQRHMGSDWNHHHVTSFNVITTEWCILKSLLRDDDVMWCRNVTINNRPYSFGNTQREPGWWSQFPNFQSRKYNDCYYKVKWII